MGREACVPLSALPLHVNGLCHVHVVLWWKSKQMSCRKALRGLEPNPPRTSPAALRTAAHTDLGAARQRSIPGPVGDRCASSSE